jgi:hypothetical protein
MRIYKRIIITDIRANGLAVNIFHNYFLIFSFYLIDGYSQVYAKELLHCVKRWLNKAPNVIKRNIPPFTPTGDINDAIFTIYSHLTEFDWWKQDYEGFDHSPMTNDYFSTLTSNSDSCWTTEQAHDYYQQLIKTGGRTNFMETNVETNQSVWKTISNNDVDDQNDEQNIPNPFKTPEELQKLKDLDNPDHIWKLKKRVKQHFIIRKKMIVQRFIEGRFTKPSDDDIKLKEQGTEDLIITEQEMMENFVEQKMKNIIQFKQLCDKK